MSAPRIETLIIQYSKWVPCIGFNYNENKIKTDSSIQEHKIDPCQGLENVQLSTRLGSSSTVGIVMKYAPPEEKSALFAMKIIPGMLRELSIRREIATSRYLSDTNSLFYPRLYSYGECQKIMFPEDKETKPGIYLVYELLSFDMRQLLSMLPSLDIKEDDLFDLIYSVFQALKDLIIRQVLHPDTHTGNIMFRCLPSGMIEPVIIDFGSCILPENIFFIYDPTPKAKIGFFSKKPLSNLNFTDRLESLPGVDLFISTCVAEFVNEQNTKRYPKITNALNAIFTLSKLEGKKSLPNYMEIFNQTYQASK